MSVQRRVNWISQQRVDVPDVRAIESAGSNDFDQLIQSFVTGTTQGYVLRGFEILMTGAIGGAASGLQMLVDPGALFHIQASQSGTVLMTPAGTSPQQLNSATNTIVDGAFTPNAINYVGIDYERFIDSTTSAQVYIWDPTTNSETTKVAPRAQILRFRLKVSTTIWPTNILPIAVVTTDAGNNVVSITDARWGLFRLGTGGASPNPFYVYPWTAQSEGRTENPSTSTSNSVNPFHGGDKMLGTLKDWMNAVMSALQEIKGTTYWYGAGSAGSISNLREDLGNTVTVGRGTITHSAVTAGLINWSDDIFLRVIGSNLAYKFTANPSSSNIQLADNQVAYVTLVRDVAIAPNLVFTNGSKIVQSVGSVSWTTPLQSGDWVRLSSDTNALYYQIDTVDSLSQVTLLLNYAGTSTGAPGAKAVYAFGTYNSSASPSTSRDIFITDRSLVPQSQDVWWFLFRSDNGGVVPRVYVRFIGQELEMGETDEIDDGVSRQLLTYIGTPSEATSRPLYTSAFSPGTPFLPQITDFTMGSAATISSNQYFYTNSSGDFRKYYVWFNKDGTGVDPAPAADRIGLMVAITTGQTNAQVATATAAVLSATGDFTAAPRANPNQHIVRSTNTSAGVTSPSSNGNVSAPFAVTTIQSGTGSGNNVIHDGDNLTLAIKELDQAIGSALNANNPNYDETLKINASVASGVNVTLPNNTRAGNIPQLYTVGKGRLVVYLNGQALNLTTATVNVTSAMLAYHMADGTYPANILLTGTMKGGVSVKYTPVSSVNLQNIRFILSRAAPGTGTGTVSAKVRTSSGAVPSGTTLGTSASYNVSSLINGFNTTVDFVFASPVALTGGTAYWFSLETDATYIAADGGSGAVIQVKDANISGGTTITPVDFVNHTSVTNAIGHQLGSVASGIVEGPSWTAAQTAAITSAQVSLSFVSGTGNVIGDLYSVVPDNTGSPNLPTLTFIESSTPLNITGISSTLLNPPLTTISFSGTNTLNSGTKYAIILRVTNVGGNVLRHNSRTSGNSGGAGTNLLFKNTAGDNLYHESTTSDNPLVYNGDVNVIATGNQTVTSGEYPVATANTGPAWTAQTTPTPSIQLDIVSGTAPDFDWTEVGASNTNSNQITMNRVLVPDDILTFRIVTSGGGGGGGGGVGPQGPPGPAGPPGSDAAGGPVAISTKTGNYTVLLTDCALKANCTGGAITFTLPAAATASGTIYNYKKLDSSANLMTIQAFGAELIDGFNTKSTSTQNVAFTLFCDGTTWSLF